MRNQTALEELSAKVLLLIEKYNRMKEENIKLKEDKIVLAEELVVSNKKIEEQNIEILRLQREEELKNEEIENITQKITKLLT
jgi:uncharacterized Zn finger protein